MISYYGPGGVEGYPEPEPIPVDIGHDLPSGGNDTEE